MLPGTASIWPFIPVFAKQMGLSEVAVGLIFTVAPMAGLIAKPFFGAMADRFKRKKKLFLFFILLNLMSYLTVAFLPQNELMRPVKLECGHGVSYIKQCTRLSNHCAETLLDSFKPPKCRDSSRFRTSSPDQQSFDDSDCMEQCTGRCEIRGFFEGVSLCTNVINRNVPQFCSMITTHSHTTLEPPRTHAIQYAPAEQVPSSPGNRTLSMRQHGRGMTSGELEFEEDDSPEPPGFNFTTKIRINHVTIDKGCLYLPISDVDFLTGNGFRGLSCNQDLVLSNCFISCDNNTALNNHLNTIQQEVELLDSMNFWMYGSLVVIAWIAMAVVESLSDALCFQTLADQPHLYGKQRLWGTVGWGLFSFISGYFIDRYSEGTLLKDYTPCFYLAAGLLTLDICVAYKWDVSLITIFYSKICYTTAEIITVLISIADSGDGEA